MFIKRIRLKISGQSRLFCKKKTELYYQESIQNTKAYDREKISQIKLKCNLNFWVQNNSTTSSREDPTAVV